MLPARMRVWARIALRRCPRRERGTAGPESSPDTPRLIATGVLRVASECVSSSGRRFLSQRDVSPSSFPASAARPQQTAREAPRQTAPGMWFSCFIDQACRSSRGGNTCQAWLAMARADPGITRLRKDGETPGLVGTTTMKHWHSWSACGHGHAGWLGLASRQGQGARVLQRCFQT